MTSEIQGMVERHDIVLPILTRVHADRSNNELITWERRHPYFVCRKIPALFDLTRS